MRKTHLSFYIFRSYRRRRLINGLAYFLLICAACLTIVPLFSAFWYVLAQGFPALNFDFFKELPKPVGEVGGGMGNALLGTITLVGIASIIGIPWGILTGMYLSEYGRGKRGEVVRFVTEILASVPSIIVGLFVYVIVVVPMKKFSALAGGLALAILMIPIIARSTEELLKMVPVHLREAGLALGIPRWRVTVSIILRGIRKPITTGIMLAVARAAGETAPLLFTAFNNRFWQRSLTQPIASLSVQIYTYAISPFEDWHRQAWAGALVLLLFVFILNGGTRLILATQRGSR